MYVLKFFDFSLSRRICVLDAIMFWTEMKNNRIPVGGYENSLGHHGNFISLLFLFLLHPPFDMSSLESNVLSFRRELVVFHTWNLKENQKSLAASLSTSCNNLVLSFSVYIFTRAEFHSVMHRYSEPCRSSTELSKLSVFIFFIAFPPLFVLITSHMHPLACIQLQ